MIILNWLKRKKLLKKIDHPDKIERLRLALYLKKDGKSEDIQLLFKLLKDEDWNVRNAASQCLIMYTSKYPELREAILEALHGLVKESPLSIKMSILEVLGKLKDHTSKPYLQNLLEESDYDLLYASVRAIGFLNDVDLLYKLKNVVYAKDYITRRAALLSVVRIVNAVKESSIKLLTPHIHLLIEVYVELNELGNVIVELLDKGDPKDFPEMRGYNEYEIVKLEELLEQRPYAPEMYQNFSRVIYPKYFILPKATY